MSKFNQQALQQQLMSISQLNWSEWLKKLPSYANWLMILLLAQATATLSWTLLPLPATPSPPNSGMAQAVPTTLARQSSINLASLHLFGLAQQQEAAPLQEVPEEAPDTTLSLTLMGVFASSDPRSAWAIIADRGNQEDIYRVDQALPGGAVLKEIHADRIILLHNGRFETLRLPQDDLTGVINRPPPVSSSPPRRTPASRFPSGATQTVGAQGVAVLKDYRQKLINDPQSVMSALRAEPYRRGGRLEGYRVFPGADKQLLEQVGLRPGDVVTSVNGIALDSPIKGLEIMQQVTDAREVTVEVLRNGAPSTFVVPLN